MDCHFGKTHRCSISPHECHKVLKLIIPVIGWFLMRRTRPLRHPFWLESHIIPKSFIVGHAISSVCVSSTSIHSYMVFTRPLLSVVLVPTARSITANRSAYLLPCTPAWLGQYIHARPCQWELSMCTTHSCHIWSLCTLCNTYWESVTIYSTQ